MKVTVEGAADTLWGAGARVASLLRGGSYRVKKEVIEGPVVNGEIRPDLIDEPFPEARAAVQTGELAVYTGYGRQVSRQIVRG